MTAIATNDGWVALLGQERGPTWYDRFAPDEGNYAGGFGFVASNGEAWCSAYAFRPDDAVVKRVFGIGYFEQVTEHAGLRVTRRTFAPAGDAPALLDDVTLENTGDAPRDARYYEYWDVARHQLEFELLRTGPFGTSGDAQREALDARFVQSAARDGDAVRVSTVAAHTDVAEGDVSPIDEYPRDVFLASLSGPPADVYTDQRAFFGDGGPAHPDAAKSGRPGELMAPASASGQPFMMATRHDLSIAPRASAHLRFAYGYVPHGAPLRIDPAWLSGDPLAASIAAWRDRLAYFASDTDPVLHREIAWRSYSLQSASAWNDYFQTHVVAQGSAYLYSHGFDGAPRDHALFALPLTYVAPARAKELLTLIMELTRGADGSIAYSYHGNGVLESAGIHDESSDLDIYFLMALAEYVAVTGDRAFLASHVPFYPRGSAPLPPGAEDDTVLDHARAALRHLVDVVGTGDHGLIKVGSGDWNDGISVYLGLGDAQRYTTASGESHANAAMAAFVLPMAADVLAPSDAALAGELRSRGAAQLAALRASWPGSSTARWYPRAWLRDATNAPVLVGNDQSFLWLEPQPWALLAGAPDDAQRATLIDAIDAKLDAPSPIGAMIQEPAPGNEESAQVWPAITGVLTWAYADAGRADLAWRSLLRNTYAAHADAYPEIWYGIWSGPDGVQGPRAAQPGIAWSSPATPMTDFPVMNANPDAMGLLAMLRAAGVEPAPDGIRLRAAAVPGGRYRLDTQLLALTVDGDHVIGEYRAANDGAIVVHAGSTAVPLAFAKGDRVPFEITASR